MIARAGDRYRLEDMLPAEIGRPGSGLALAVPAGFEFDLSVPPGLAWLVDPHDPAHLPAAALHDYALARGWDRVTAAALFHAALRAAGVPRWRRLVMFLAVALYRYT